MDGIKTDLFPCNLRTGKKYGRKSGDSEVGERKASFRNVVIYVEEIVKIKGTKEEEINLIAHEIIIFILSARSI